MDREAWRAAVPGVAKRWTRLSGWVELSLSTQDGFPVPLFLSFWLCWVFVCCADFTLVAASGSAALVAVLQLLVEAASLTAERGL